MIGIFRLRGKLLPPYNATKPTTEKRDNMSEEPDIVDFRGVSGEVYAFEVYPDDTEFDDEGAVYVFTKITPFKATPLYIGETETLGTRIANHEKWECADKHGCTHICVYWVGSKEEGLEIETDLRHNYNTPCNDQ